MKKFSIFTMLCFCMVFTACEEEVGAENALLYEAWTHAREEQEDANATQMIFRLSDSQTFAASRFRQSYDFNADGSCEYLFLDPADAHHFRSCSFTYDVENSTLTIVDDNSDLNESYKVIELSADKLVIERQ